MFKHPRSSGHLPACSFMVRILAVMNNFLFSYKLLWLSSVPAAWLMAKNQQQIIYNFKKYISVSFTCWKPLRRVRAQPARPLYLVISACLETSPSEGHSRILYRFRLGKWLTDLLIDCHTNQQITRWITPKTNQCESSLVWDVWIISRLFSVIQIRSCFFLIIVTSVSRKHSWGIWPLCKIQKGDFSLNVYYLHEQWQQ